MKPRANLRPPRLADKLFRWYCENAAVEDLHGDLEELFCLNAERTSPWRASAKYWQQVLSLISSYAIKKRKQKSILSPYAYTTINFAMIRNYLKIALRNLLKNTGYSLINIVGLGTGMAVAILIGLWIRDEITFDRNHSHYTRIAQVMQHQNFNGQIGTQQSLPYPIGEEIRNVYGNDFNYVVMSSWTSGHILAYRERKFTKDGNFMEPDGTELLSLEMVKGTRSGLREPYSIMISESLATAYFEDADPLGKVMRMDNQIDVKVTGVYRDLPQNSSFSDMHFVAPWELLLITQTWIKRMENPWRNNSFQCFAELRDADALERVSTKIRDVKMKNIRKEEMGFKPQVFLFPMSKWHLRDEFKDGVNTGGRIKFVWLFGTIGLFVLLLACINFMNLSTARSEKRSREVGIRKAIGSFRSQLIHQFFTESVLVSTVAFLLAVLLVQFSLPFFNELSNKRIALLWDNPAFWLLGAGFSIAVGLIAGSYPALYLSSFQPVSVLKGTFRAGRFASLPRKALVVVQFTVSVTLIIGTIIVFRQIQFAKNRPMGYDRNGLVLVELQNVEVLAHLDAMREELIASGAIVEMAEASSPPTDVWSTNSGFEWRGKDPDMAVDFPNAAVSYDYGKTVAWQILEGRDFSREFKSDSASFVFNETAIKFMGLKNPVGETIHWRGNTYTIIGVVRDMVMQSPYQPVKPSVFHLSNQEENVAILKVNPAASTLESLGRIETTFKKYDPATPFAYRFADDAFARKFNNEVRIGKLATCFATLAIFISSLGIFGLASFVAEQRTKEIGVRKVMGASTFNLWKMLSADFVLLTAVSLILASPLSYFAMSDWLQKYTYRTEISWWIFAATAIGTLSITLLTVSFHAVRAALANPVNSLRME